MRGNRHTFGLVAASIAVSPAKLQPGDDLRRAESRQARARAGHQRSRPQTVKVPTIAPGKSRTVTVKLGGGTFKLWCPIPGHAALGMTRSLTISGTAASGGATSGGGGTTPPGTTTNSGDAWG